MALALGQWVRLSRMAADTVVGEGRSDRVPIKVPVVLIDPSTGQPEYTGVAMDASPRGFRFRSNFCPLAPGQEVDAIIMQESGCLVRCRVVWVATPDSGLYGEAGFEILGSAWTAAA